MMASDKKGNCDISSIVCGLKLIMENVQHNLFCQIRQDGHLSINQLNYLFYGEAASFLQIPAKKYHLHTNNLNSSFFKDPTNCNGKQVQQIVIGL